MKQHITRTLDDLADWLVGNEVAYARLDGFRTRLGIAPETFAALLGKTPRTLTGWRRAGRVPLRGRDEVHAAVRAARNRGSLYGPQAPSGANRGGDSGCDMLTSQTAPKDRELRGLTRAESTPATPAQVAIASLPAFWPLRRQLHGRPCRWGPKLSPCATCTQVEGALRLSAEEGVRAVHAPQAGDDYDACECAVCSAC